MLAAVGVGGTAPCGVGGGRPSARDSAEPRGVLALMARSIAILSGVGCNTTVVIRAFGGIFF
jgi:hypothetical protein